MAKMHNIYLHAACLHEMLLNHSLCFQLGHLVEQFIEINENM